MQKKMTLIGEEAELKELQHKVSLRLKKRNITCKVEDVKEEIAEEEIAEEKKVEEYSKPRRTKK